MGCENGEFYSVPGDCAAFYTCIDGRLLKRKCPNGLNWNQKTRLCDWRSNTGCDESAGTPTTESYKSIYHIIFLKTIPALIGKKN